MEGVDEVAGSGTPSMGCSGAGVVLSSKRVWPAIPLAKPCQALAAPGPPRRALQAAARLACSRLPPARDPLHVIRGQACAGKGERLEAARRTGLGLAEGLAEGVARCPGGSGYSCHGTVVWVTPSESSLTKI